MQAQLNSILGLHRTTSRVSIDSITSFAGSTKTKSAFKKFCQNLYQMGVRADMIKEKEGEILNIFKPQNTVSTGQIDVGNIADQRKPHDAGFSGRIDDDHNILDQSKPHDAPISGQIHDSNTADQISPQNKAISGQMDIVDRSQFGIVSNFQVSGTDVLYTNRK